MIREEIIEVIKKILGELEITGVEPVVEHPSDDKHGDYSSNIALMLSKKLKKNPMELAEKIKERLTAASSFVEKIEVAKPGFINFWLSKESLMSSIVRIIKEKDDFGQGMALSGKKIMVEFAHPNTHKLFHIGHLRNIFLGETICRLLEAQKVKVIRANYQGDVGLHIAKALWAIKKLGMKRLTTLEARTKFLADAYVMGNNAYGKKDEKICKEIEELNRRLYGGDQELIKLWEETRGWSLDYFDRIYKRVGTKFDRLYFESEVAEPGKKAVLENLDKVFIQDQGAVIFPGKKCGLHNRVFINSIGLPTYEGKDVGLAKLQFEEFGPSRIIHVVGPEQKGYFEVVFKALEMLNPQWSGKEYHLLYGWVQLKEGKMSSRTGDIVEGEWLLGEAKSRIKKEFPEMDEWTAEKVAVGAVKYSMLKFARESDIQFSFNESISLEGDSSPYLQYTFVRTQSVIGKAESSQSTVYSQLFYKRTNQLTMNDEEVQLLRLLHCFSEVIEKAAQQFAPNVICHYLFALAQKFNLFYQKHPIITGGEKKEFRLALTTAVGQVLKNGLYLLGIEAPERM